MKVLVDHTTKLLNWTSRLTHIVISLALVSATVLLTALFFHDIYLAVTSHSLIKGFLHALGILLLLWTMVELIKTELDHLHGGAVDVAVFIEVAQVLCQGYKSGFSVPVVFRGKAQCAGNGCSIAKHCNAAAGHHRSARRVGLSASMAAFRLLQRTTAIRGEARLGPER